MNQFKGTRKLNQHLYPRGKAPIKISFVHLLKYISPLPLYFTLLRKSKYIYKLRNRYYQIGLQIMKKIWTYWDGSLLSADLTLNSNLLTADIERSYMYNV